MKSVDEALERIHGRRISNKSCATLSFDDVMYSDKYVFVDIAYDVHPTGAIASAECLFEAPATEENIEIAKQILDAIEEEYGIEVSSDLDGAHNKEKWDWIRVFGEERAHVVGRLVFVETPNPQCFRYYEVYENDRYGAARTFATVQICGNRIQAISEDFSPILFYENKIDAWEWYNSSPIEKRKIFKKIEKAFLETYPDF